MRLDCGCRKALSFHNVFIKPKRSALPTRNVDLSRRMKFKYATEDWEGVPIIAANMDHTGTFEMANALSEFDCMTALHKFYPQESLVEFAKKRTPYNTWFSIGMRQDDLEKFEDTIFEIRKETGNYLWRPKICIDVANGYTEKFADYVASIREKFRYSIIMAGNVATFEMTEQLILSGADIVKVGIGPGSVCTTRKMTGVGYPQLSAIDECADAAHGLGGMICADGGCTCPGDVSKAFAAGADFVMLGGMLAGHDECNGLFVSPDGSEHSQEELKELKGNMFYQEPVGMKFYGMSSTEAQEKHYGGKKTYRASEGKATVVPYRGQVHNTMIEILGGIRSTMTYIGASRLKDMPKCATFVITNEQLNQSFS